MITTHIHDHASSSMVLIWLYESCESGLIMAAVEAIDQDVSDICLPAMLFVTLSLSYEL